MRGHFSDVAGVYRGLSDARADQEEALYELAGGIAEGEEMSFGRKRMSTKSAMATIQRSIRQDAMTTRESAQMIRPEKVEKALVYM